jgi:hypothetical protein
MPGVVRTVRHGTARLKDGGGSQITIPKMTAGIEDADMYNRGVQPVMDRGTIAELIYLDDELLAVSFSISFSEWYGEGAAATANSLKPSEFMLNDKNNASATLTKVDTAQDVFNFDLELTVLNPVGAGSEVITWKKCVATNVKLKEGYPNVLSFSIVAQSKTVVSTVTT